MKPRARLSIILLSCLICSGQLSFAQAIFSPPPNDKRLRIPITYTREKIRPDGHLSEAAWLQCPVASHFTITYPDQGGAPSAETEVRVLYDSVNLYIGAVCHFHGSKKNLQVQDLRRDFGYGNELFCVMIEPFRDPRVPVTGLYVSPYGNISDVLCYLDGTYDYNWDALWQADASISDSTWTAELAIPFSSIRYRPDDTAWSINFSRNIRIEGQSSTWSPVPFAYTPSHMEYAGLLTGIHSPKPGMNLRIEPYVLAKAPGPGQLQGGGEIKWAVNTNTLVEGTVNTDFAQADVDQQVVNLTRSSVFFPEKRQFFKENANLFALGQDGIMQPFFSRRIGLNDAGTPVPLNGGIRMIHQSAKEAGGLLLMRQKADSVDNPAWFGVLRYKRNLGTGFQLGGMGVWRYDEPVIKAPGSLNTVGAVDAFWKISQPLFVRSMYSLSANSASGERGGASVTEVQYNDNLLAADLVETYVSGSYHAKTGYQARTDFINTLPSLQLFIKDKRLPHHIAFFNPQINASIFHQASSGILQEATVNLIPAGFIFRDLGQLNITLTKSWENLSEPFSPVSIIRIAAGKYYYSRYELYYLSNQSAHYSMEARISTGGYYDGRLNSYYISLRAAPDPHFSLLMSYTRNDFQSVGAAGATATTHLLAPQLRLAFNPKILLSAFYQYNTAASTGAFNGRFSWEYRPLSFVCLVYNDTQDIHSPLHARVPGQQSAILKISYIRQL